MVGNNNPKDLYTVGQRGQKPYSVGGNGKSVGQASNGQLNGGDQDSPTGAKSAFKYSDDKPSTYKDIGDKNENSNFGGNVKDGVAKIPLGPNGEVKLEFGQKGDWSDSKMAMARRAAISDTAKTFSGRGSQYQSPVVDSYPIGKK